MLKKIMSVLTQVARNPSNNVQPVRGINYPFRTGNFKYYPYHKRDMSLLTPPTFIKRIYAFLLEGKLIFLTHMRSMKVMWLCPCLFIILIQEKKSERESAAYSIALLAYRFQSTSQLSTYPTLFHLLKCTGATCKAQSSTYLFSISACLRH